MRTQRTLVALIFVGCQQTPPPEAQGGILIESLRVSEMGLSIEVTASVRNGSSDTPLFVASNQQYLKYVDDRKALLFVFSDEPASEWDYDCPATSVAISDHHRAHLLRLPPRGRVELTSSFDRRIRIPYCRNSSEYDADLEDVHEIEFRVAFLAQPLLPSPNETPEDRRRRFMREATIASVTVDR